MNDEAKTARNIVAKARDLDLSDGEAVVEVALDMLDFAFPWRKRASWALVERRATDGAGVEELTVEYIGAVPARDVVGALSRLTDRGVSVRVNRDVVLDDVSERGYVVGDAQGLEVVGRIAEPGWRRRGLGPSVNVMDFHGTARPVSRGSLRPAGESAVAALADVVVHHSGEVVTVYTDVGPLTGLAIWYEDGVRGARVRLRWAYPAGWPGRYPACDGVHPGLTNEDTLSIPAAWVIRVGPPVEPRAATHNWVLDAARTYAGTLVTVPVARVDVLSMDPTGRATVHVRVEGDNGAEAAVVTSRDHKTGRWSEAVVQAGGLSDTARHAASQAAVLSDASRLANRLTRLGRTDGAALDVVAREWRRAERMEWGLDHGAVEVEGTALELKCRLAVEYARVQLRHAVAEALGGELPSAPMASNPII